MSTPELEQLRLELRILQAARAFRRYDAGVQQLGQATLKFQTKVTQRGFRMAASEQHIEPNADEDGQSPSDMRARLNEFIVSATSRLKPPYLSPAQLDQSAREVAREYCRVAFPMLRGIRSRVFVNTEFIGPENVPACEFADLQKQRDALRAEIGALNGDYLRVMRAIQAECYQHKRLTLCFLVIQQFLGFFFPDKATPHRKDLEGLLLRTIRTIGIRNLDELDAHWVKRVAQDGERTVDRRRHVTAAEIVGAAHFDYSDWLPERFTKKDLAALRKVQRGQELLLPEDECPPGSPDAALRVARTCMNRLHILDSGFPDGRSLNRQKLSEVASIVLEPFVDSDRASASQISDKRLRLRLTLPTDSTAKLFVLFGVPKKITSEPHQLQPLAPYTFAGKFRVTEYVAAIRNSLNEARSSPE